MNETSRVDVNKVNEYVCVLTTTSSPYETTRDESDPVVVWAAMRK